jgi:hypothetical protein
MSFQFPGTPLPTSLNPQPNAYPASLVARETADLPDFLGPDERESAARRISRRVLDSFWLDMGFAHNSAAMQVMQGHPLHGYYQDRARANRERIAREREVEARRVRRLNAA